ncbi:sigma-70 family RNA polymerase sigma factor [Tissierella praeacuta]|uniref:sigma-70 family RNA polymerase sigma factor n=1 Tax=Tissierella praeacuta TaxID=43131 RepID=UPI002FDA0DF5
MHQSIIDYIYKIYKKKGYVSEDLVFDALIENNIPLDEVDYICEILLSMGVLIKNDDIDEEDDVFIYDRSQTNFEEIYRQVIEVDESLEPFIDEVRIITPPQHREWYNLIIQAQNGNKYAKERIVLMYLRIVIKIALNHHQRYNISLSEAIQDGCIGLIIAVEKFEIGKQDNFSQYAPWWIRQYLMRKAEPSGSIFRYPVHYKDKMFLTYEIISQHDCNKCMDEKLCSNLIEEVSQKLECDYNEAVSWIHSLSSAVSCEEMIENDENLFNDDGLFEEKLDDFLDCKELKTNLDVVLSTLKERERKVIELRFGLGECSNPKTLEEIGTTFNLTRERIRQIESKAIKKLRHTSRSKVIKSYW